MDCKICVARNCDCLCKTCTRVREMKPISNEEKIKLSDNVGS